MTDRQRNGFILLLVVGLIAASVVVDRDAVKTRLGLDLKGGVELVYQGEPTAADAGRHPGRAARARSTSCASGSTSSASPSRRSRPRAATRSRSACRTSRTSPRAEKQVGTTARLDVLRLGGERADAERQDRREPAADPGSDARRRSARGRQRPRPGSPAPGSMTLYDAVKLASKQPAGRASDNARARARSTTCSARPAAPRARPPPRLAGRRRRRSVSTACSPGPDDNARRTCSSRPPAGRQRRRGRSMLVVPPGHGRAAGRRRRAPTHQTQLRQPRRRSSTCSRTTSRCSATTSPTRSRAPTRAGSPDVTFGFTSQGRERVPERHRDRSPTAASSSAGSARRSTSTSRSRSTTS